MISDSNTRINRSKRGRLLTRRRFIQAAGATGVTAVTGVEGVDGARVQEAEIVLDCRTLFTGGDGDAFESIVAEFNDEHDDVEIEVQRVPWDEYYDQIFTMMAGGEAPDIGVFHHNRLLEFHGNLVPLDDVDLDPYSEAALDGRLEVDDTVYGLPMDFLARAMYYNREIFEEAGLDPEDPPEGDWDEFRDACDAIVDAGYEQATFDPGANPYQGDIWESWLHQRGGQVLRETDGSFEAAFNDEDGLAVTEPWEHLVEDWRWCQPEAEPSQENFVEGAHAIINDGTWAYSRFREGGGEELGFDWGVFKPLQAPGKEQDRVASNTHTLGVPRREDRSEEQTQAAIEAVTWITQNTHQWATQAGHMPAAVEVAESDEVRESDAWEKTLNVFFEMAEEGNYFTVPTTGHEDELFEAIGGNIDAVRFGEKSPQAALDDAEERVNLALED